jgi:hypothetical protein
VNEHPVLVPGPTPKDEAILPPDPELEAKSLAVLDDDAKEYGWRFGRSVLSRSEPWGAVWCADVSLPKAILRGSSFGGRIPRAMTAAGAMLLWFTSLFRRERPRRDAGERARWPPGSRLS